ncbi:hypothetical protein EVAR_20839_1 [Eumeta japonica]|uniref:Uncharacterized protein n=1 Tax=Eumeta variegata TaxID=151549 RepID=A0A4C1UDJ5_EUMVA|nr:hypothetical protein EVAR_20839_1 [Eumeta japonica]
MLFLAGRHVRARASAVSPICNSMRRVLAAEVLHAAPRGSVTDLTITPHLHEKQTVQANENKFRNVTGIKHTNGGRASAAVLAPVSNRTRHAPATGHCQARARLTGCAYTRAGSWGSKMSQRFHTTELRLEISAWITMNTNFWNEIFSAGAASMRTCRRRDLLRARAVGVDRQLGVDLDPAN